MRAEFLKKKGITIKYSTNKKMYYVKGRNSDGNLEEGYYDKNEIEAWNDYSVKAGKVIEAP